MTSQQVDLFSERLSKELAALSWQDKNDLLIKIGKMELRMRSAGQERPLWRGPKPEVDLLSKDVVIPTEQGERRGRVICFGVVQCPDSLDFERSVVVYVPASGTHHEAPGSVTRIASKEDSERIQSEVEWAQKLRKLDDEIQKGPTPMAEPAKPKRRGEKDPALVEKMLAAAKDSKNVKMIEEGGANYKIVGINPDRRLYLFKNQLRVDVSGFSFDHLGLRKISDQEARDMHLGKVRGQVLFDDKKAAFDAFVQALEQLK